MYIIQTAGSNQVATYEKVEKAFEKISAWKKAKIFAAIYTYSYHYKELSDEEGFDLLLEIHEVETEYNLTICDLLTWSQLFPTA